MNYASLGKRLGAKVIDTLIIGIIAFTILFFYYAKFSLGLELMLVFGALFVTYNVIFVYFKGATPGKFAMKIIVVNTDSSKISLKNAIYREIIMAFYLICNAFGNLLVLGTLLIWNLFLGFMLLFGVAEKFKFFFDARKKTLHDYLADTVVVNYE